MYELKLTNVDKSNVLVGLDTGLKFRKELNLDELEKEDKKISIKIDDNIISPSQSFILGLFKDSMNILETKEDFYNKYIFDCDKYIKMDIDNNIGWMYDHKNYYLKNLKKLSESAKKKITKNKQYRLRMTEEEFNDLELLSKQTNLSKSNIIRTALKEFKEKGEYNMRATDMINLYVGYNKEEDFRILICSVEGEKEAQRLANAYGEDSNLRGEFEIQEFDDINTHFDCDYVII